MLEILGRTTGEQAASAALIYRSYRIATGSPDDPDIPNMWFRSQKSTTTTSTGFPTVIPIIRTR